MRINRTVIVALGIAGALSGCKKTDGEKEPNVVRPEKYKAQEERLKQLIATNEELRKTASERAKKYKAQEERLKELTAKNEGLRKTVSDSAKALSEQKRKNASATAGFAPLPGAWREVVSSIRVESDELGNPVLRVGSQYVQSFSSLTLAVETVLNAPEESLQNDSGSLPTSLASPLAKAFKSVEVETLAILLQKDPKSVEGNTLPQAVMDFAADAQTAEEVREIARFAIATIRAEVLLTIAGVLKRSSKVEALGILVAAIEEGDVEKVSRLLGNPSEQSIEMQAIGALASGLEQGNSGQSKVETLMAKLELTVQERALIDATLNRAFRTVSSIVESTREFIADNELH